MTDAPRLLPLEIEVGRVLAVVAHPDDLEYGAAAAVAGWTDAGHDVAYLLVTKGEAGIDGMSPEMTGPLRAAEEVASAAVVGVTTVEFLDHPDGTVQAGLPLRRDVAAAIRQHRPGHTAAVQPPGDLGPRLAQLTGPPKHRDRRAGRDRRRGQPLDLPELLRDGLHPHSVKHAVVAGSPHSTHALDVSATVDRAVASLSEHRAYLQGLGDHPMADPEFLRMFLEMAGDRFRGTGAAVPFELFSF